ncbi:MAG: CaiB/BaiF CoA transferase family protein [Desertimonas sp.]
MSALGHIRICDLSGQLAGAGATRALAALGAQVIRVEDPVTKGRWDIVRQIGPFLGGGHGPDDATGFVNHNVDKLGITLNLRLERGRELLTELIAISNAVTENFAAGVMDRLGFGYDRLREIRPGVVYVSNCGFGHTGPYHEFKSWGPIVQAMSGLTHTSTLPGGEPAGWGYSYMDHTGGYSMAIALLAALHRQQRTGEGEWVDIACVEAGVAMTGPAVLDELANGRDARDPSLSSNRSAAATMAPHGIFPAAGDDSWVAIACRDDADWAALASIIDEPWAHDPALGDLPGRRHAEDRIEASLATWTAQRDRDETVARCRAAGLPAAPVKRPVERCDDPALIARGLWPTATHAKHGPVRVDGLPVHLSATDWSIERAGPILGEHNEQVLGDLLGLSGAEIGVLADEGVI